MSEILSNMLQQQIMRLKAIDFEKINDTITEMQNELKSLKNENSELIYANRELSELLEKLPPKITIDEVRKYDINVAEKGFLAMVITTAVAILVAIGSFWYAKNSSQTHIQAIQVVDWADYGQYQNWWLKKNKPKLYQFLNNDYKARKTDGFGRRLFYTEF